MTELALPRAIPGEKVVTMASAFVVPMVSGAIGRANPTAGKVMVLLSTLGAGIGSLVTRGITAEVLEGAAAGSLGALGYLTPFALGSKGTRGRGVLETGSLREIAGNLTGLKQLSSGTGRRIPAEVEEYPVRYTRT